MPGSLNVTGGIRTLFDAPDRTEPDPADFINPDFWKDGGGWYNSRGFGSVGFDARIGGGANMRGGCWESPDRSYGTPGYDEYKHLKRKTIPWNFATRITPLATNTTLGTATRHDTPAITLRIPEIVFSQPNNIERYIANAKLIVTFRTENAAASTTDVDATRIGIQVGAGPTTDFDRPFPLGVTANRNQYVTLDVDVTDYVRRWFTGATASAVASLAVQQSAASNVNCITFKLLITYAHNATTNTRLKCIRIPIQSHSTALTTTQQEVGCDGISPAPTGQIPALDTFLPEVSKTYRQITLCLYGNDGMNTAGTVITPLLQIDATAEVARATVTANVSTVCTYYDQYELLGLITTNATHTFNMRCDTTLSTKMYWVGGWIEVVYEYDHAATLANNLAMYEALVPLTMPDGVSTSSQVYDSSGGTAIETVNGTCIVADLDIHEPGPITIQQSGLVAFMVVSSASTPTFKQAGTAQPMRSWTPQSSMGPAILVHRCDINNGWTLQRGRNRLPFLLYNSAGRTTTGVSYAIINYTAGVRVDVENGNHPVFYNVDQLRPTLSATVAQEQSQQNAYTKTPKLGNPYYLSAVFVECWFIASAGMSTMYGLERQPDEIDGDARYGNSVSLIAMNAAGNNISSCYGMCYVLTTNFNRDSLHTGRMNIEKPRRTMVQTNNNTFSSMIGMWVSYHQHAYPITGTVTVNSVAVAAGKTLEVWAKDLSNPLRPADLVTTVQTTVGGVYSASVPDDVRTYFVTYSNDGNNGRSADGTPGVSTFDVSMGGTGSGGYSRGRVANL